MAEPVEVPVKLIADVNEAVASLASSGKPELAKAVLQMRDLLRAHRQSLDAATAPRGTVG
jgi:hypothetical protein